MKRNYEDFASDESNSTISFSEVREVVRRRSFWVTWDPSLDIPKQLKKMRKFRLCLSMEEFARLEYQLYITGCVAPNPKYQPAYNFPAIKIDLNADKSKEKKNHFYVKLLRYISVFDASKLLTWVHFNKSMSHPTIELEALFSQADPEAMDIDRCGRIIPRNFKVNDNYTLYNAEWTELQRVAARNTRNHLLRGFQTKRPMIWDLDTRDSSNAEAVKLFLVALLKGRVDSAIVCDICCRLLGKSINDFDDTVVLDIIEHPRRERMEEIAQRSSITDFGVNVQHVYAADVIRRYYLKHLQKRRQAVQTIENWWEPERLENERVREEFRTSIREEIRENAPPDYFQYDDFIKEVKEDYAKAKDPTPRPLMYWLSAAGILGIPILITVLIPIEGMFQGNNFIYWFFLNILFQFFIYYRRIKLVLWIQTLLLLWWVIATYRGVFGMDVDTTRLMILMVVVPIGKKKWIQLLVLVFAACMVLSLTIPEFNRVSIGWTIVVYIYDFYFVSTIAAASRKGSAIEMLHKTAVNVVYLMVIGFSAFFATMYACLYGTE